MVGLELMSMLVLTSLSCGVTWPHLEGHLTASLPALPEAPDALTSTCGALQPPNLCYSHTLTPSVSLFPLWITKHRTIHPLLSGCKNDACPNPVGCQDPLVT